MSGYVPAQTAEERTLQKRVEDSAHRAAQGAGPWYTAFLSGREQQLALAALSRAGHEAYTLWGGYDGAERRILCVHAPWDEPAFSLTIFQAVYPSSIPLTHRDFLGALLALGIKRELVGDILARDGSAYFFVTGAAGPLIQSELSTVGRAGVRLYPADELPDTFAPKPPETGHATVASLRLDAVLAAALHKSRTAASDIVRAGAVKLNDRQVFSGAVQLSPGDSFTVAGYGKFRIGDETGKSRKNRTFIEIEQF